IFQRPFSHVNPVVVRRNKKTLGQKADTANNVTHRRAASISACCSGGGKDALIRRLGVLASVGALFPVRGGKVPHSQRGICANSIRLVLVEPAFGC
ncbi:MAG: hypothetical protein WBD97_25535, partial [Pseudolabrys sp.]